MPNKMHNEEVREAKAFILDTSDSRKSILIELEDGSIANTGYVGRISYDSSETPEITILKSKNTRQGITNVTIYDKQTFLFEPDKIMVVKMKKFFTENSDISHLMIARKGSESHVLTVPKKFITSAQMSGEGEQKSKGLKAKSEKNDYKAYETPSNLLEKLIETIDKKSFETIAKSHTREKLRSIIAKSTYFEKADTILGGVGISRTVDYAATYLLSLAIGNLIYAKKTKIWAEAEGDRDYRAFQHLIKGAEEDEKITNITSFFSEITKEGLEKGYMANATSPDNAKRWKEITGKTIKQSVVPIFDPHAGSGKGMLAAFDNRHFKGLLQGIELRDIKHDDKRCEIITGVNIADHYNALSTTFENRMLKYNAEHLISYHNPPYTSDDSIAKETIQAYPDRMIITGLFPVKLKAFLTNNLMSNSIIVKVPRELTGYTDPKTPEDFLFVIGEKLNKEEAFKDLESSSTRREGVNSPVFKTAKSMEDLDEVLNMHFANHMTFANRLGSSYEYYTSNSRDTALISKIKTEVETGEMILRNREKIAGLLEEKIDVLLGHMSPIEVAKRQKVFPDNRFYSQSGVTDMFTFSEVLANVPLLVHYRDKNPEMFSLVESVAQSLNVSMPIDTKKLDPYVFGEKPTSKKERVTSKSLGMMRLFYNPSMISLKEEKSKKILMDILLSCYDYKIDEEKEQQLKAAIEVAHSLVTKSETTVDHGTGQIMPSDVFVLVDEFGGDIGKLDIDIDDVYSQMESKGLFSIDDYIELAEISTQKQEILMDNFLNDMKSTVGILADKAGVDKEGMMNDLVATGMLLYTKARKRTLKNEEKFQVIFDFIEKYDIETTFKELYKNDVNRYEKDIIKSLETSYLGVLSKEHIEMISKFIREEAEANTILFYEDNLESVVETVNEKIGEYYFLDDRARLIDCKSKFSDELSDLTTPLYQSRKSIAISYSRMGEMLLSYYVPMRYHMNGTASESGMERSDKNISALYTSLFKRMFTTTLGLQPHQYNEAERFVEIGDETKMKQLFIEARGGKTRTFIAMGYFLSLFNKKQMNIIVETSNMTDISNQMAESFPHLALRGNYFVGDEGKVNKNPNHIFKHLPTMEAYPLPFRSLPQTRFVGGGAAVVELVKGFGKRYDITREALEEEYGDIEGEELLGILKEKYKDSKFAKILRACGES